MIRTQIQVHPGQMKWLKKHALEKGVSMAQAIRDSVDFYRYHTETIRTTQSKKKKTLNVIGSFSTDISKSN
jgi:hypothetical protein